MRLKQLLILSFLLAMFICLPGIGKGIVIVKAQDDIIDVTSVNLNEEKLVMTVDDTVTLEAIIEPFDATNKELTWQSDNTRYVDLVGVVTSNSMEFRAISPGVAFITVTTVDGGKTDRCEIKVIAAVGSFSFDPPEVTIKPGESITLDIFIVPKEALEQPLTVHSTEAGVATVTLIEPDHISLLNHQVKVTALKEGETRIGVRSERDPGVSAFCNLVVSAAEPQTDTQSESQQTDTDDRSPESKGITEQEQVSQYEPDKPGGHLLSGSSPTLLYMGLGIFLIGGILTALYINHKRKPVAGKTIKLKAVSGHFEGKNIKLVKNRLVIGKDPREAQLVYPGSNQRISRIHCTIKYDEPSSSFIIIDSSTNGTYFAGGAKLEPGKPYVLKPGDRFYLADKIEMFEI
jgi:hypothetical protein